MFVQVTVTCRDTLIKLEDLLIIFKNPHKIHLLEEVLLLECPNAGDLEVLPSKPHPKTHTASLAPIPKAQKTAFPSVSNIPTLTPCHLPP